MLRRRRVPAGSPLCPWSRFYPALTPAFYRSVATDPLWSSVKAVRDKRIYMAPNLPYGWFDAPPGVNRLIGVRWLVSILYPRQFPESLRDTAREFYKLFYQVDLTEPQLDSLLISEPTPTRSDDMKISARNVLKGKIPKVTKGATTAHVKIDIGGAIVTSSITNAAVDELKLAPGKEAYAVIKASDVMIGVD